MSAETSKSCPHPWIRSCEGKRAPKGLVRQRVRSPRICVAPQGVRSLDVLSIASRTVAHLAGHPATDDSRMPNDQWHTGSHSDPAPDCHRKPIRFR
jgi:hypothetical protein